MGQRDQWTQQKARQNSNRKTQPRASKTIPAAHSQAAPPQRVRAPRCEAAPRRPRRRPSQSMPQPTRQSEQERPPSTAEQSVPSCLISAEPARKLRNVSHSLTKPLNSGSPAIEQQANKNSRSGERHPALQPAEFLQIYSMGCIRNRAGAEKQQALEKRMIESVQQRRDERQSRPSGSMMRQKNQRGSQSQER